MPPKDSTTTLQGPNDRHIQTRATNAGVGLRNALAALLDELASSGAREQRAIQSALNLSQSATSRLVSGARINDPLATLARIPGPEGLRKMLKGASRAGVSRDCLDKVEQAILQVEHLIDADLGDRYSLDALLSDWVHESRAGFEMRQKAAAYKAMSAIRGVQAQSVANCWIIGPSDTPGLHDSIDVQAMFGCRRVRPNAVLHATTEHLSPLTKPYRYQRLDGGPVRGLDDTLIAEFSTVDPASMHTRHEGSMTQTLVHDLPLGRDRGADFVTAVLYRGLHRAFRSPGESRTAGVAANVEPACQDIVLDVLLHDSVWPDVQPELRIFDTIVRGLAHPDNPVRQADRLDMLESVVFLGRGRHTFRVAEIPRYTELIGFVCDRAGWDTERLRGYRCKIRYPVYGSQVCMAFVLPDAPLDAR